MKVIAKKQFSDKFFTFSVEDRQKILDFITYVEQHNLHGLAGS